MDDCAGNIQLSKDARGGRAREESRAPGFEVALSSRDVSLADIWSGLRDGRAALTHHFVSDDACYARLEARSDAEATARRMSAAQSEVFVRLAVGERQKTIAIDLQISPAAVAQRARRCIQLLGLSCKPSSLPLFVVLAALTESPSAWRAATVSVEHLDDGRGGLYRLARSDLALPRELSPAEQEIARMLVGGRAPNEIARARQTTAGTVSNQLRSIFAKLGVTGRLELIALLAQRLWGSS